MLAAITLLGILLWIDSNRVTTPDAIARRLHVLLPEYEIVESSDNMDRTASSWSDYCFTIRFTEPLDLDYLNHLKKIKTCSLSDGEYHLKDEKTDEWYAWLSISPENNTARIEYTFHDYLF